LGKSGTEASHVLSPKKPCKQDYILIAGFSIFKGSLLNNALEARWNLGLRASKVFSYLQNISQASIGNACRHVHFVEAQIFCRLFITNKNQEHFRLKQS